MTSPSSLIGKATTLLADLRSETDTHVVLQQKTYFRPSTPAIKQLDPALSDLEALPVLQDTLLRTLFSEWKALTINTLLLVEVLQWIVSLTPTMINLAGAELLCHILNTESVRVLDDMFFAAVQTLEFANSNSVRQFEAKIGYELSGWMEKCKRNPTIVETIQATLNELTCALTAENIIDVPVEMITCNDIYLLGFAGRCCVFLNMTALDFVWSRSMNKYPESMHGNLKETFKVDLAALLMHELSHVALHKACTNMDAHDARQKESGRLSEIRLFGGQARNFSASLRDLDIGWVNRFVAAVNAGRSLPVYVDSVNAAIGDEILSAGMVRKYPEQWFY